MNKLQSYLSSLDSTTTVSEEDVQNTLALLNMYAPLVRQSVRRLDEFSMQCYDSRRQSISDFINLAIDFDQDADRKRIADRLASMGHSLQLLELLEEALVLVKEDPRHDGIYYRILKARYFNVYCRSNEDAFLDAGVSWHNLFRTIRAHTTGEELGTVINRWKYGSGFGMSRSQSPTSGWALPKTMRT